LCSSIKALKPSKVEGIYTHLSGVMPVFLDDVVQIRAKEESKNQNPQTKFAICVSFVEAEVLI